MVFHSFSFVLFFPVTLLLYYWISERYKKFWLLFVSALYFYYVSGWFLLAVYAFGILSWGAGILLCKHRKKTVFLICLALSLLPLTVFKIINRGYHIVIPMGLSFYSLQAISYLTELYRGEREQTADFFDYMLFMTFFPSASSGPIKRSKDFLPQIGQNHSFCYENVRNGLYKMALGYLEKIVLADQLYDLVNNVFTNYAELSGAHIIIGTVAFGIQIYFDFAGYSHLAIGAAQVLGYKIPDNFRQPYFATSIKDFWHRWHISLSTWLRDYIYFPLGGSRVSGFRKQVNLMITFLVSGLWHGCGLNYLVWGGLHGIYQIAGSITGGIRRKIRNVFHLSETNVIYRLWQRMIVFLLVDYAWMFFRADGLRAGIDMTGKMLFDCSPTEGLAEWFFNVGLNKLQLCLWIMTLLFLYVLDLCREHKVNLEQRLASQRLPVRWIIYLAVMGVLLLGVLSGVGREADAFIYNNF